MPWDKKKYYSDYVPDTEVDNLHVLNIKLEVKQVLFRSGFQIQPLNLCYFSISHCFQYVCCVDLYQPQINKTPGVHDFQVLLVCEEPSRMQSGCRTMVCIYLASYEKIFLIARAVSKLEHAFHTRISIPAIENIQRYDYQ